MAETGAAIGTPAKDAYRRAFDTFAANRPAFQAPLMRLGQLVDAADDRTLAHYGVALSRYAETGDRTAIDEVMPALQAGMAALASSTGDAGYAEGLGNLSPPASLAPAALPAQGEGLHSDAPRPGWGPEGYSPSRDTLLHPPQATPTVT